MAFNLQNPFSVFVFVCSIASAFASHTPIVNGDWFSPALGTWYGDPKGAGSTGGACGWAGDVQSPPFSAMIAAGNPSIYMQGKGCGDCYQIKCSQAPYCSGNPITVTITDECPGCTDAPFHFDLSGTAFGAMAWPGQDWNLRNLGKIDIQYRRVPCYYGGTKIAFKIDAGATPNWFATSIEYVDGDGGLRSVEISPGGAQNFVQMRNIWGAIWEADLNPSQRGPFSFRITSSPTSRVVVATNAVPMGFVPGHTYFSSINF